MADSIGLQPTDDAQPPAGGEDPAAPVDAGIACLVLLLRFFGMPGEPEQIRHQFGRPGETATADDLLRAAKRLELKARLVDTKWGRLGTTPLPAIAETKDGGFIIVGSIKDGEILIQDPKVGRPQTLTQQIGRAHV